LNHNKTTHRSGLSWLSC